jgi:transcriptional regulator with XRE-family HTH domain
MDMRNLREKADLTILDVAKELRCAESTVRNWEKGRSVPKLEVWQVFKLRDLYKCSESDLIKAVEETLRKVGK